MMMTREVMSGRSVPELDRMALNSGISGRQQGHSKPKASELMSTNRDLA